MTRKMYINGNNMANNESKVLFGLMIYIFDSDSFCIPEIFKTNVSNQFLITKLPFGFVYSRCEFTKVII